MPRPGRTALPTLNSSSPRRALLIRARGAMSDVSDEEDERFDFVAAPSDDDDTVTDDESLTSALKLLQPPSAARASSTQAEAAAPARAADEEPSDSGRAEVCLLAQTGALTLCTRSR